MGLQLILLLVALIREMLGALKKKKYVKILKQYILFLNVAEG